MLCYAGFSVLLTKVRCLIHEEILLLSVLKFPFRVLTPLATRSAESEAFFAQLKPLTQEPEKRDTSRPSPPE